MASSTVRDAVKAVLGDTFAGLPVYRPNDPRGDTPNDASPFIAFAFPVTSSEQITFGSPGQNTFRETGSLQVVVTATRGLDPAGADGLDSGLAAADAVRAAFRNLMVGALHFWEMSPPVEEGSSGDGSYYRLTMACPYWLDFWA